MERHDRDVLFHIIFSKVYLKNTKKTISIMNQIFQ